MRPRSSYKASDVKYSELQNPEGDAMLPLEGWKPRDPLNAGVFIPTIGLPISPGAPALLLPTDPLLSGSYLTNIPCGGWSWMTKDPPPF